LDLEEFEQEAKELCRSLIAIDPSNESDFNSFVDDGFSCKKCSYVTNKKMAEPCAHTRQGKTVLLPERRFVDSIPNYGFD